MTSKQVVLLMMNEQQTARKKQSELADFQNLEKIGQGAFGKVYRAIHKLSKKVFALKKISQRQIEAQNMMEQLNNEIKILKQLNHPHIVRLFDTFTDGEDIYLVMEFVNGQLFTRLTKEGKLDQRTTKRMVREVTEAVAYLHEQTPPIIHRDIKPENILLDKNNQVKLADFGWSNFMNTPRKTYCGTFDYLAPEMIDKSGHDQRLDIWCLGVLAYQLLTGKTPFLVKGPREEAKKIIVKNILEVNISFPNDFPILAKHFILGVLKRRPEDRMGIKELLNHEWLDLSKNNRADQLRLMYKMGSKDGTAINAQDHNIIEALNKRIRELQEEVNNAKVNERVCADNQKGVGENSQYLLLMKELRKLRGVQQKNLQLLNDNEKYWKELSQKDKEIIQLKGQIKMMEDNRENIEKLKNEKKVLTEKIHKLENDLEASQTKYKQLLIKNEMNRDTITEKVWKGEIISLSEAQTAEYLKLLLQQMQELESKFKESQTTLLAVLNRNKFTQQKEEELIRLRLEQKTYRDEIRQQLKEKYDELKDQGLQETRTVLSEEREKWFKQRQQLRQFYEQQINNCPNNKISNPHEDCQLELKTLRQLEIDRQRTINELRRKVRELQQLEQRRLK